MRNTGHLFARQCYIKGVTGVHGCRPEVGCHHIHPGDGGAFFISWTKGRLCRLAEVDGIAVRYDKEPGVTLQQRFMSGFVMLLPILHLS